MSRYLPISAVIGAAAVGAAWRIVQHRREHGSTGIALWQTGQWREHTPELIMFAFAALLVGEAVAWAIWPATMLSLAVTPPRVGAGVILLVAGLTLVVFAQIHLGESWRIGIDHAARPGLVIDGLYRISRNPIFLGMFVSLAGFVLLMTTVLSLVVLVGSVLVIRHQVRREETYLLEAYGSAYRSYAQRVGRFLPWIGRLG